MAPQIVPIHRINADASTNRKDDIWFNAFDFSSGQDSTIRWLSRPNQQLVQAKYSYDTEKFRITFDVENFQADQIKVKNCLKQIFYLIAFFFIRSTFKILD
jgi:hypothetical protein